MPATLGIRTREPLLADGEISYTSLLFQAGVDIMIRCSDVISAASKRNTAAVFRKTSILIFEVVSMFACGNKGSV
jgi:hypothetical protein